jgi:Cu+-exporting ATPase
MVKDLVCRMKIDPAKAVATAVYQGQTYYFCSYGCKESFLKSPDKYIEKEKQGTDKKN